MSLLKLEHGKLAYISDFFLYGAAVTVMAIYLLVAGPPDHKLEIAALALLGLAAWTGIEYALHRFVLHGLQPFRRWHAAHHERPMALICTPTIMSAMLIVTLVFMPALLLGNWWRAFALTFGVLGGYFAYGITHHATHHWHGNSAWLRRRKQCHALHHHLEPSGYYGVTVSFWDHVFGTARRPAPPAPSPRQPNAFGVHAEIMNAGDADMGNKK